MPANGSQNLRNRWPIVTLGFHETDGGRHSLQAFLLRTTRIMVALGHPEHWRIGRWSLSSFLELV